MHPPVAPEARVYVRELWDAVTHAAAGVFAVGGPESGAGNPPRTRDEVVIATVVKQAIVARQDPTEPSQRPDSSPLPSEVLPTPTSRLPSEVLDGGVVSTASQRDAAPTVGSTETSLVIAPEITRPAETSAPGIGQGSATTPPQSSPSAAAESGGSNNDIGMKAGIIFGSLGGVLVIMICVWLLFSRRRKQMDGQREADDEKLNGPLDPFSDSAAIRTPTKAPRLSLRPVTQFLPLGVLPERRTSRSAGLVLSTIEEPKESPLQRPAGGSAWERPTVSSSAYSPISWDRPETSTSFNSANPFNDPQRNRGEPSQERPVSPVSPVPTAVRLASPTPEPVSPIDGPEELPWGTAAAHAAGAGKPGLARKASLRKDAPRPLDLTMPPTPSYLDFVPPSPAGTEYSMHSVAPGQKLGPSTSAAAIAAAGGPPQSTVHRVTLDFAPTLDDELELRAGQLVRLLHEYDDGWALCIRLDRSEQGVVPRTCLSTRPVKPRNHGSGPRGPPVSMRRPSHPSQPGMDSRGHRRQGSPAGPVYGRPESPAGRSMSPAPAYHNRPHSPSGANRKNNNNPLKPSHMNQQQRPPQDDGMGYPGQAY